MTAEDTSYIWLDCPDLEDVILAAKEICENNNVPYDPKNVYVAGDVDGNIAVSVIDKEKK